MNLYYWFLIIVMLLQVLRMDDNPLSKQKAHKRVAIVGFILLTLISGLKARTVGVDTRSYMNRFYSTDYFMSTLEDNAEYGYVLLGHFVKNILGGGWQTYLLIVYTCMYAVLARFFYKYSKSVGLSFFFFITIGNFTMYLSGLRQSIAISFCLLAYMILDNDKIKPLLKYLIFCLLVYIGTTMHQSAYVFYLVPFFQKMRFTKRQIMIFSFIAISTLFFRGLLVRVIEFFIPEKYSEYGLNETTYQMNYMLILIDFLIPVACNVVGRCEEDGKYDRLTSNMFIMSIAALVFRILTQNSNQLARLGYYFVTSQSILIPNTVKSLKDKGEATIVLFIIMVLSLTMFVMGSVDGTLRIDNYRFFWQ